MSQEGASHVDGPSAPTPAVRAQMLDIARAALAAVNGAVVVRHALAGCSGSVDLVAIGKAAVAMANGALGSTGVVVERGLVIAPHGLGSSELSAHPGVRMMTAGHPLPDRHSLDAGRHLVDFVASAPPDRRLLFLISGGASALVEQLPDGLTLADWRRANAWLLGSGLAIDAVNTVRRTLSNLKGGRLARHLAGRSARVLLLSDVPGDRPCDIGSGLLVADTAPLLAPEALGLPPWLVRMLGRAVPGPAPDDPVFGRMDVEVVAGNRHALAGAAKRARELGFIPGIAPAPLSGDARVTGRQIAETLLAMPTGMAIYGGETVVTLPKQPGRGGRNQHLALAAAEVLAGYKGLFLLALGTDGRDGPTADAGALVDGGTVLRGAAAGLDAKTCLDRADAGRFLSASDDLIRTGPTGTNVMDLVIGLRLVA